MKHESMEHHAEKLLSGKDQGRKTEVFYRNNQGDIPIADLAEAFRLKDRVLRCIDERTGGGLHLGGSGVLLSNAIEVVRSMNVEAITSHAGCGAAKMAAAEAGIPVERVEHYAEQWSRTLARQLGVPYQGHLPVTPEFHIARVAYYDGTGQFDWSHIPGGLPAGFTISRKYLDPEYAKREIDIAASIAMGDHGYGDLISQSPYSQFVFVAIGSSI